MRRATAAGAALKVRVSGVPGAHIRYREGYYAAKDFGVFTTEDRERQLEEAMPLGDAGRRAACRRRNRLLPIDRQGQIFVPISAKIASSALQWAQKSNRQQVEFRFRRRDSRRPVKPRGRRAAGHHHRQSGRRALPASAAERLVISGRHRPAAGRLQAEIPGARKRNRPHRHVRGRTQAARSRRGPLAA